MVYLISNRWKAEQRNCLYGRATTAFSMKCQGVWGNVPHSSMFCKRSSRNPDIWYMIGSYSIKTRCCPSANDVICMTSKGGAFIRNPERSRNKVRKNMDSSSSSSKALCVLWRSGFGERAKGRDAIFIMDTFEL